MNERSSCRLILFAIFGIVGTAGAQNKQVPSSVQVSISPTSSDNSASLPPLQDPATENQIHEYLRLSGDLDSFRLRWIAAVDKNRSIGEPYWPEAFWTAIKAEMQKTDLMRMFITVYQHGVSKELMQQVIDTYHALGAAHFQGSPACFKLGDAQLAMTTDIDKLKLAKTQEVLTKVYAVYKPQIKAARARYLTEHPDWVDK
jgi:hypothetical protein